MGELRFLSVFLSAVSLVPSIAMAGWHIETVDSKGSVGLYTSLALDSRGNAHISYYDSANFDLKYAFWDTSSTMPGDPGDGG